MSKLWLVCEKVYVELFDVETDHLRCFLFCSKVDNGNPQDVKFLFLSTFQSGILLTLSDHNPDMLSLAQKYQTQVYQADAHFHLGQQKKAEVRTHCSKLNSGECVVFTIL